MKYIEINTSCENAQQKPGPGPRADAEETFQKFFIVFMAQLYHDFHGASSVGVAAKPLHSLINKVVLNVNCILYSSTKSVSERAFS